MATLTTKYDVGDVVWTANTATEQRQHDCPDCLGARKWTCASPAGGEFEIDCPRCSASYQSDLELSLRYTVWAPAVRSLTIGLVRASSETGDSYDSGNTYMCCETGVGSGTIYRESDLFPTREEAEAAAAAKAATQNADADGWVAKQYNRTVKLSDYQLKDAAIEAAQSASRRALYEVGYLLEDLDQADTIEQVRDRMAEWREKREAA